MKYYAREFDFSEILDPYNKQWQEHLKSNIKILKEVYDIIKNLEIVDVYDDYSLHIQFHNPKSSTSSKLFAYRNKTSKKFSSNFNINPQQQKRFFEVLTSFPFDKVKNQIKKKRESLLLEELKSTYVGLSILDVIDNGEVIQVQLSNDKQYPYNDFGNISHMKELFGLS